MMTPLTESRSERILIIDDEPTVGRFVGMILRQAGFDVQYAQNPLEGLHWAIESRPDLVITDYEMDEINGAELCVRLKSREETKRIPVVFMSGKVGSDGDEVAHFSGASACFHKPIAIGRLIRVVQNLLLGAL